MLSTEEQSTSLLHKNLSISTSSNNKRHRWTSALGIYHKTHLEEKQDLYSIHKPNMSKESQHSLLEYECSPEVPLNMDAVPQRTANIDFARGHMSALQALSVSITDSKSARRLRRRRRTLRITEVLQVEQPESLVGDRCLQVHVERHQAHVKLTCANLGLEHLGTLTQIVRYWGMIQINQPYQQTLSEASI